jgi:uncharacterized glyoxalase superfamily protein PhnB
MTTSIRTILHTTAQRSNLVRFYREGLGLGDPDHSAGEESFQIGDVTLRISSDASRLRAPVPRTSLTFVVDDLEEHVEHLKAAGVPFDIEPSADGHGSRRAVCRDPDGNFVALLSGPRVARKRKDDDGRPSKVSRKVAKKGKPGKRAHKAKPAKPAKPKKAKSAKSAKKKKK